MFGLFRSKTKQPVASKPGQAPLEFQPSPEVDRDKELAKYEALGQTLVITVIAETLSGPDARVLIGEIASRSAYSSAGEAQGNSSTRPRHFVLDLQNVEYMDSACLGALVELLQAMQSRGGRIALVNTGRNVEYLFRLTQLDRLFPICRDVMTAIESVERGAANAKQAGKKPKRRGWD
ncbi:MAG: STAS domain-containing protein [Planctomycetota bacterium]